MNENIIFMSEMGDGPRPHEMESANKKSEHNVTPEVPAGMEQRPSGLIVPKNLENRRAQPPETRGRKVGRTVVEEQPKEASATTPVETKQEQKTSPAPVEEGKEKPEEVLDKAEKEAGAGNVEEAKRLLRESVAGDDEELKRKMESLEKVLDSDASREELLAVIQDAGSDTAAQKALEPFLKDKFTKEELQDLYDEAGVEVAPTDDSPDAGPTEGEDEVESGPTGEMTEEKFSKMTPEQQMKAILPVVEGARNGDKAAAENLGKMLKWGLGKMIKYTVYLALAAYVTYIGLMARTGNMVKK
jgi:hypothetical protein